MFLRFQRSFRFISFRMHKRRCLRWINVAKRFPWTEKRQKNCSFLWRHANLLFSLMLFLLKRNTQHRENLYWEFLLVILQKHYINNAFVCMFHISILRFFRLLLLQTNAHIFYFEPWKCQRHRNAFYSTAKHLLRFLFMPEVAELCLAQCSRHFGNASKPKQTDKVKFSQLEAKSNWFAWNF